MATEINQRFVERTLVDVAPGLHPGVCRVCGCTDTDPCELNETQACWWIDEAHTLCSNPRCVAVVPLSQIDFDVFI
jgi:hypothetical protein